MCSPGHKPIFLKFALKHHQVDIDVRHCGWVNCQLPASTNAPTRHLTVELKGPDQSLRLRQLKVNSLLITLKSLFLLKCVINNNKYQKL